MRIPRITRSIFLDQFIYMQIVGVFIGLSFPHFLVWYGFPAEQVLNLNFYIVTQIAGQIVGLISFLLISTVVRPHLKALASRMQDIATGLEKKHFIDNREQCHDGMCHLAVSSDDEVGVSARAYNHLLDALIESHETEQVFKQFTQVMSENLEMKSLAEETIALLIRSTHIEAAAIYVQQGSELKVIASTGIMEAASLAQHEGVVRCLNTGEAQRLPLPEGIKLDGLLTQFSPSEVFLDPIEFKGTQLGVLVSATGAKKADDKTRFILDLFTRSVGLALNNAMIHTKFQKLAAVDGLTNVYNRRFGMARLKEDFGRSIREQSALSVVMIDIDHFKSINDTYGHLTGDKAIVLIASLMKKTLREGDLVVRYGGEEFLMILHGASTQDAIEIGERVRHQVMDSVIQEGSQAIKLTVSVGISSFPEVKVQDEIELIDQADRALYHAKQTGRNKVVTCGQLSLD